MRASHPRACCWGWGCKPQVPKQKLEPHIPGSLLGWGCEPHVLGSVVRGRDMSFMSPGPLSGSGTQASRPQAGIGGRERKSHVPGPVARVRDTSLTSPGGTSFHPLMLQVPAHWFLLCWQPADWSLCDSILTNLHITLILDSLILILKCQHGKFRKDFIFTYLLLHIF